MILHAQFTKHDKETEETRQSKNTHTYFKAAQPDITIKLLNHACENVSVVEMAQIIRTSAMNYKLSQGEFMGQNSGNNRISIDLLWRIRNRFSSSLKASRNPVIRSA